MLNTLEQQTTPRFMATLEPSTGEAPAKVRIPIAISGTWARGSDKFSITRDDLESIVRNFRERQNGEINVDYDHASEMPEVAAGGPIPSAGRIVGMDPPETQGRRTILWGWYDPTERARSLIHNREYRYISPAIDWGARNKRTGKPQGATLTSVALTNRPFLEEMPQIRLADPAYRLVDANAEGSYADVPQDAQPTGGIMKKVNLSVADGKIQVTHPDFAGPYYADPDELQNCLQSLGAPGQPQSPEASQEVPVSEAASVLSEAEAQGKSVPAVEIFRARVEQALDDAVRTGRILPRRRDDWRRIGLADFETFSRLMAEQTTQIALHPVGFSGSGPGDVQAQVKFLAEQRMRERSISYGQALTEIGREQPDLIHQYRRAVSGGR